MSVMKERLGHESFGLSRRFLLSVFRPFFDAVCTGVCPPPWVPPSRPPFGVGADAGMKRIQYGYGRCGDCGEG